MRLPKAFRRPGTEVRVWRSGRGIVLEPIGRDPEEIQAILDRLKRLTKNDGPLMPDECSRVAGLRLEDGTFGDGRPVQQGRSSIQITTKVGPSAHVGKG